MHYYCCRREIVLQRATPFVLRADKKGNQNFGHSASSKTSLRRYNDNINQSERNTEECVVWNGLNLGQERDKYQTAVHPVMNFLFP